MVEEKQSGIPPDSEEPKSTFAIIVILNGSASLVVVTCQFGKQTLVGSASDGTHKPPSNMNGNAHEQIVYHDVSPIFSVLTLQKKCKKKQENHQFGMQV